MKKILFIGVFLLVIILLIVFWPFRKEPMPISFDECKLFGYELSNTYPQECHGPNNSVFVEYIGNELDKKNLIQIFNPRPNQIITSPLIIEGQARGYWFFEADFPVYLYDANMNVLALGVAVAQTEWMTESFVSFLVELEFETPKTLKGTLILEKDNPSGLPEYDDFLKIPVVFDRN